jgi:hypothetical protein
MKSHKLSMFICYYFVLYIEKKVDKTWMTKSKGTREYRDGCRLFVDFAVNNCQIPNGNIHCPCKSCRNNQCHPPGVVLAHLTRSKGIITTYTTWFWHGEKHVRGLAEGSYSNHSAANAASGSTEQGGNMHAMLRDAFGMHEVREDNCKPEVMVQEGEEIGWNEEPAEGDTNKYYDLLKMSEKPLHWGTKHSKLSATVHLYNLKCVSGLSNNIFFALLGVHHSVDACM